MKKILFRIENGLLAEGIHRTLRESGDFLPCRSIGDDDFISECERFLPEIVLMETSFAPMSTLEQCMEMRNVLQKKIPHCKFVLLCDEKAAPDTARLVMLAKQDGLIDAFFYSSVTGSYLCAALNAL